MPAIVSKIPRRWGALALCLWAMVAMVAGVVGFIENNADFRGRWTQCQYALRGVNIFDVQHDPSLAHEDLGPVNENYGYYPWSVGVGLLMAWPSSYAVAKVWYLATQVLCLLFIGYYCYRQLSPWGVWAGALAAGCFLSMTSIYTSIKWGNYSIFVLACLAAMDGCLRRRTVGWSLAAGLFLSLALVKPQMAALFGLYALLVWRDWVACLTAALLVAGLTLAVAWQVAATPWGMIADMTSNAMTWGYHNQGLLDLLKFLISTKIVLALDLVVGLGLMFCLLRRYHGHASSSLLAIPAMCTVLWSYNNKYDWAILGFVILAGLRLYFAGRAAGLAVAALRWWLVGLAFVVTVVMAKAQYAVIADNEYANHVFSSAVQTAARVYFLAALFYLLRFEAWSGLLARAPVMAVPAPAPPAAKA